MRREFDSRYPHMKFRLTLSFTVIISIIFALCFAALIAVKVNLITADLGRHVENGKVILTGTSSEVQNILHTNFYSYTYQSFPFINHHWGIGVIFYTLWQWFGWNGPSVFYIATGTAAFLVSLYLALKLGNPLAAFLAALCAMPLVTMRKEVRPEMLTNLFMLIFFALLWLYWKKKIKRTWLLLLPVFELAWVNIHIGFVFGEVVVAVFFFCLLVQGKREWRDIRFMGLILALVVVATLINPNGIHGALYPAFIFSNYGYQVYENQSLSSRSKTWVFMQMILLFLNFCSFGSWFLAGLYVLRTKRWAFLLEPLTVVTAVASIFALEAYRSIIIFALFAIPFDSFLLAHYFKNVKPIVQKSIIGIMTLTLIGSTYSITEAMGPAWGIGLLPGNEKSAEFFKEHNLQGTIYNDYDIGSFIDLELGPGKVFVDNRPEAYPASFFSDIYIS
jgi:hypothetical protein